MEENGMAVGRLVEVQPRTWPGINKPGGIARVTNVHWRTLESTSTISHVDVQYILGSSKEKHVPIEFVQLAPQYESSAQDRRRSSALRDRSMLLGRCRRCGSLRTDCGSCDWATEEHDTTARSQRRMTKQKANHHSSSSSSEEEDVLLQEMLQQNQRKYRKFLQYKMQFNASQMKSSTVQRKRKRKTPRSDKPASSSEEDEDEERFSANAAARYRSYLKHKAQWQRRERRMQQLQYASVLESLPKPTNPNSKDVHSPEKPTAGSNEDSEDILMVDSPMVGAAVYSSSSEASARSCSGPQMDVFDDDNTPQPPLDDYSFSHASPAEMDADRSPADQDLLALSQFIQPEGLEVAENLPQDTVDRTKDLPYQDLPHFFDTMATQIEDDWLPDWKLQIAKLTRAKRQLEIPSLSPAADPTHLLQKTQEVISNVREQLIRSGTDQCRIALHKLVDDRLYRKARPKLSVSQRKLCRGSGILETRNLRMDALDDAVEELVRKLRDVVQACEDQLEDGRTVDDAAAESDDASGDFGNESSSFGSPSPIKAISTSPQMNAIPPPSPLFHRHMHASRVKSRTERYACHSKKRTQRKTSAERTHRKRTKSWSQRRSQEMPLRSNVMSRSSRRDPSEDLESALLQATDDSVPRSSRREPSAQPQADDKENDMDLSCVFIDADAAASRPPKRKRRSTTTNNNKRSLPSSRGESTTTQPPNRTTWRVVSSSESNVPTFNLFDHHPPSTSTSNRQSCRGERALSSRRVPISKRMEAFLDANSGEGYDWRQEEETRQEGENGGARRSRKNGLSNRRGSSRQLLQAPNDSLQGNKDGQPQRLSSFQGTRSHLTRGEVEERIESMDDDNELDTARAGQGPVRQTESLFSQLEESSVEETASTVTACNVDISEFCQQLEAAYPQSPSRCLAWLRRVKTALSQAAATDTDRNELVSSKNPILKAHIELLSQCLCSLRKISVDDVRNPGSVLERVVTNLQTFTDILVLQLVDTVYALLHPTAWALQIRDPSTAMATLRPLCDALAKSTPLIEAASCCIVERLGPQQWRRGLTPKHAFVSCICASDWKSYLLDGATPPKPAEVRLQALGNVWPRLETEAIWSLLAFLARSKSIVANGRSNSRWQLMSKLFSCGVLAQDEVEIKSTEKLPPSKAQLSACEKEIGFFATLLDRGSLDILPSSDSVLVRLIQRGLALQADEYTSILQSSEQFHSAIAGRGAKKFVGRLWVASHPLFFSEPSTIQGRIDSSFSMCSIDNGEKDSFRVQDLLVPTSGVLKRSLELLSTWVRHLPNKKVRQNRFKGALNTLRKGLLNDVHGPSKQEKCTTTKQSTAFESAFGTGGQEDEASGSERARSFKREAAAWLRIAEQTCQRGRSNANDRFDAYSFTNKVSSSSAQIWDIIASDCMKDRRIMMMENNQPNNPLASDSFHLLVAAKVMASIAMLQLNICPWFLDIGTRPTHVLSTEHVSEDSLYNNESFIFAMSCVTTCLDCLCDLKKESPITAHVCSILILLFTNCTACFQLNGVMCPVKSQTKESLLSMLPPVFVRCFKSQINSPGGSEQATTFRLLLSAIRSFASFLAIAQSSISMTQAQIDSVEDDELWGSIDDDLLATIDLDGSGNAKTLKTHCPEELLAECLKHSIQQSKPSERFSILQESADKKASDRLQMTAHGKHIVAKDVERVCDCLVSLQAIDAGKNIGPHLSHLVVQPIQSFFHENNDAEFSSTVSQRLCSELTALSNAYKSCQNFVKAHSESITFSFLRLLLDSRRLELFPSCNLERIRDIAGEPAGEQALALLDAFNDYSQTQAADASVDALARLQRKRRRKAQRVWSLCSNFGQILSEQEPTRSHHAYEEALAMALKERDFDLSRKPDSLLDAQSLEQETLECLRLLRTFVSACAKCGAEFRAAVESLMAFSLASILFNTLKIVRSVKYQEDQESRNPDNIEILRRVRIQELLCAYKELFVALVSWILRENRSDVSDQWKALQLRLRDNFLSPVLQRKHTDWTASFQQILNASIAVITGNSFQAPEVTIAGLPGCSKYLDGLVGRIVRRSRQLLIASSKCPALLSIQSYLAEAIVCSRGDAGDQDSVTVGAAFDIDSSNSCISIYNPLQDGIDEYISFVERHTAVGNLTDLMKSTKTNFLDKCVIPRLNLRKTDVDAKKRLLRLIGQIVIGMKDSEMSLIRSLVKGLRFSLLQCLNEPIVNDSFVSALFDCSSAFANAPANVGSRRDQSLISWCRDVANDPTKETMTDLSPNEACGVYLWLYLNWLYHIGKTVVDIGRAGNDDEMAFRKLCCSDSKEADDVPIGLRQIRETMELDTLHGMLGRWENLLFSSKTKNVQHVLNVYAKVASSKKTTNQHNEKWTPTTASRKSAKEFMAEVVAFG
eukprot:scaffold23625_cov137-Cylindrotheca_fusiformis.AAC.2